MKLLLLLFCVVTLFCGCSSTSHIMAATGGAYTVSISGTTGFTPLGRLRKRAYEEANQFAQSKGKIAEVISVNEIPEAFGRWPQVDLRFRLASPDEEIREPIVSVGHQATHDALGNITDENVDIRQASDKDFYRKLTELGELKNKGLLTDEEFQREKDKLINAQSK